MHALPLSIHASLQSGLSPLSPGQWKPFLGWYAGFYAINSLLKPVRFVLALGVAPHTNQFMWFLQERFQFSKSLAVASSTAALMIISGGLIATAISVASLASGTPVVPSSMLN